MLLKESKICVLGSMYQLFIQNNLVWNTFIQNLNALKPDDAPPEDSRIYMSTSLSSHSWSYPTRRQNCKRWTGSESEYKAVLYGKFFFTLWVVKP